MSGRPGLTGLLLVNLGTPEAPTPAAVKRYLREFLSDPLVVDLHPLLWRPLLELVVLPRRAPRSAELYRRVWTEHGSPLLVHGLALRERLQAELGADFAVALAMRYGAPSLAASLERLRELGIERLLVLPLFPQYSRTTVGTIERRVQQLAPRLGLPEPRFVPSFPDDAGYVACLAQEVRRALGGVPEHLVISFHGLPVRYARNGDPYPNECERTARALAAALALAPERWSLAYQSRFGREPWLGPSTEQVALRLAARTPRLAVVCPGFAADCLETLDEIGEVLAARFRRAGGERLVLVPCLNAGRDWVRTLAEIAVRRLAAGAGGRAGPA